MKFYMKLEDDKLKVLVQFCAYYETDQPLLEIKWKWAWPAPKGAWPKNLFWMIITHDSLSKYAISAQYLQRLSLNSHF